MVYVTGVEVEIYDSEEKSMLEKKPICKNNIVIEIYRHKLIRVTPKKNNFSLL